MPRRRLITVALLLLAVVAAGWLLSPGIDRRLVGEWVNVDPTRFAGWRQFNADGTHRYSSDAALGLSPSSGSWSAAGNALTFNQRVVPFTPAGTIRRFVYDFINRFRQGSGTEHYKILAVTPDTLRIQSDSGAPIEEYRRKP